MRLNAAEHEVDGPVRPDRGVGDVAAHRVHPRSSVGVVLGEAGELLLEDRQHLGCGVDGVDPSPGPGERQGEPSGSDTELDHRCPGRGECHQCGDRSIGGVARCVPPVIDLGEARAVGSRPEPVAPVVVSAVAHGVSLPSGARYPRPVGHRGVRAP